MKRLGEEKVLKGHKETISMMELRCRPGEVLTQASMGKVFIITSHGKAVAVLSGLPGVELSVVIDKAGVASYEI